MKTTLLILSSLIASVSFADTMGVPDLPADASMWTPLNVFYAGFIAGIVVGGSAFIVRFLRLPGKQNPEI